jgi:hypothetical protein
MFFGVCRLLDFDGLFSLLVLFGSKRFVVLVRFGPVGMGIHFLGLFSRFNSVFLELGVCLCVFTCSLGGSWKT